MIKHIVCYKVKNEYLDKLSEAKSLFLSMQDQIDEIITIEVGFNVVKSDRSYDMVLIITFDNLLGLGLYQKHPYHVNVVKPFIHMIKESSVSVDFEA